MQLTVSSDGKSADFYVMGEIYNGWMKLEDDTGAVDVVNALDALDDSVSEITVHINSYGGMVSEGVAIYNALRQHRAKVTTVCEGFACSIASVVFMAGDERIMRPASLLMLHNASMPVNGDSNAHKKAAEDLETITALSKTAYLAHATDALTEEKLTEIMDAETWVSPETALEWGLATSISDEAVDGDPSQSAARLVQSALLAQCEHTGTPAWAEQLFCRMDDLEQLITATPNVHETPAATSPDEDSESGREPVNARVANIFQHLFE